MQNVPESCPLEMSLIRLYGRATFVLSKQDSLHNYVWSYSSSETRKGECNYWFWFCNSAWVLNYFFFLLAVSFYASHFITQVLSLFFHDVKTQMVVVVFSFIN